MYRNVIAVGIAWTLFLASLGYAASLGISVGNTEDPGDYDLFFRSMLRGGYAETIITIGSSSANEPQLISIIVDEKLRGWLTFDSGNNFTLNPGIQYKLRAIASPPLDAANGVYDGLVSFRASPKPSGNETGFGSTVVAAVALKTAIEVTGEERKEARVTGISVKSTEEGLPIEISVSMENRGNVRVRPRIHIDILSQDKSAVLKSADYSEEEILPTQTKALKVLMPSDGLAIAQYWADVSVYLDEELLKKDTPTFDILEKGALRTTGELLQVWNEPWVGVGDLVKNVATFQNTGETATSAKFRGEVSLDGKVVEALDSDELDVSTGEIANFTEYFKPQKEGRYVISGHVVYSKKITSIKESVLNAVGSNGITGSATGYAGSFNPMIIILAIVLVVGAFGVKKMLRR